MRGCPQSIVDATRQMVHVSVSYGYGASHTLHPWSCTWRLVLRHNITRTSVCVRPLPALASPDSARSSRTTRGWGERRGAGDALAEIDAVDGSAENRNRRARRGRAAQSPHPVPGERSATVRGHKPHRQRSHGVTRPRTRYTSSATSLRHPPCVGSPRYSISAAPGRRGCAICVTPIDRYTGPRRAPETRAGRPVRRRSPDESRSCSVALYSILGRTANN